MQDTRWAKTEHLTSRQLRRQDRIRRASWPETRPRIAPTLPLLTRRPICVSPTRIQACPRCSCHAVATAQLPALAAWRYSGRPERAHMAPAGAAAAVSRGMVPGRRPDSTSLVPPLHLACMGNHLLSVEVGEVRRAWHARSLAWLGCAGRRETRATPPAPLADPPDPDPPPGPRESVDSARKRPASTAAQATAR